MYALIGELLAYRDRIQRDNHDPAFVIPTPTLNLGHIHGGDNSNRICGACTLWIDIRFLPRMSFAALKAEIEQLAAGVADARGLALATQTYGDGQAMDTDAASEIAQFLTRATGKPPGSVAFGTEAPYYNAMQTETIVIGPGSIRQAHQPDEYLPLAHVEPAIDLLCRAIERFCVE